MRFPTCVVWAFIAAFGVGPTAQGISLPTASHPLSPNDKGGMEESGPYEVVAGHFKPPHPAGWTWAAVPGVYAESPDRVYIYSRGMLPALDQYTRAGVPVRVATDSSDPKSELGKVARREHILTIYDRKGNLIDEWKHLDALHQAGSLPHRIRVSPYDPEKHLWLIDEGNTRFEVRGQILKTTRDGKIVMRMGPDKVTHPQDIAFMPNGDFWCVFGFGSNRVVKFSKDGTQLAEFAGGGHGITIDSRGRVYLGQDTNIRIYDQTGKLLETWPNVRIGPGSLAIDKNDRLWVASGTIARIAAFDLSGKLLYHWGVLGMEPGQLYGVSQFTTDSEGNLYVVEHYGGRAQMFRPKKGADPKHLIGEILQ